MGEASVQTGNIVDKIDRVHRLHFILNGKEVNTYAVESDKPNGPEIPACNRP